LKIGEDGFIYSEMEEKWKIQISLLLYVWESAKKGIKLRKTTKK
jgi:hypothetical protein